MTRIKLHPHEWPAADQKMWSALQESGNPLDGVGAFAHLRASTIAQHQAGYGRWIAWLTAIDPAALGEPPLSRITAERVVAWMGSMEADAPYSRVMRLDTLIRVVVAVDRDACVRKLRRIRAIHFAQAQDRNGERKHGRILSGRVLLQAGLDLAGQHADAASILERMQTLRDGAMLAFLAMLPIRRRAFVGLELGHSVLLTAQSIEIALSPEMTKTGNTWTAMVPDPLEGLLRHYLSEARPFLLHRGNEAHAMLWVADSGRPFGYSYMGRRIADLTEKMIGVRVPPHFFRDAAATTLARESPEHARSAGPLLGHTSFRTAEKHYNHARAIEAGRTYNESLQRIRSQS